MPQFFNQYVVEHVTVDGTNYALSAGTSDVNSSAVDTAGYTEVNFIVTLGVMAASSTCDFKVQESADGSTGWTDLTGTASTQAVNTDDDKQVGISILNPLKRYLRVATTRGDSGNTTIQGLLAIKGPVRKQVASGQSTGTGQFIAQPEKFNSPVAGTA